MSCFFANNVMFRSTGLVLRTAARQAAAHKRLPRRHMGGGHGHGGGTKYGDKYGGFPDPHVSPVHKNWGTGMSALMWFWVFHRCREDGASVLGLVHPWDAHGDDHGHDGHDDDEDEGWTKVVGEMPTKPAAALSGPMAPGTAEAEAAAEVDIFRDTLVRYLGYANELGESFRPVLPQLVVPSYAVAFLYVLGDTVDKGRKAAGAGAGAGAPPPQDGDVDGPGAGAGAAEVARLRVMDACSDTLVWQTLASVAIPGFLINRVVKGTTMAMPALRLPAVATKWLPTAVGLAMIPLIIHPIDQFVDYLLDSTSRPYMRGVVREAEEQAAAAGKNSSKPEGESA